MEQKESKEDDEKKIKEKEEWKKSRMVRDSADL
jgi:hypothetical protein